MFRQALKAEALKLGRIALLEGSRAPEGEGWAGHQQYPTPTAASRASPPLLFILLSFAMKTMMCVPLY